MDLLVHYSDSVHLIPGIPREVARYVIKEGKNKHEKFSFILRVSNNIHQIPQLESADLQEEWTEEEKIPIKKDAPPPPKPAEQPKPTDAPAAEGQQPAGDTEMKQEEQKQQPAPAEAPKQEFEIRKKNKKATSALNVDPQSYALPQQARDNFFNQEKTWFSEDKNILDFKAIKNELESYSYDMKNNIDSYGPLEKFIEEGARDQFLKRLTETIDWIYGEGQTAPAEQYRTRLSEFKLIGIPVKNRQRFHEEIPIYFEQF
jgi:hypothetical protein